MSEEGIKTKSGPAKSEWRVTVYDVIFGELSFLDIQTSYFPNYIKNLI